MYERPDMTRCIKYLREVAEALVHLHSQGVIHLDIKLLNILRYNFRLRLTDMDAATDEGTPCTTLHGFKHAVMCYMFILA